VCGIAGWAGSVDIDEGLLRQMCDCIAHRGPDDDGYHVEAGRVGLGFRRLSIVDLATGAQPLPNEDLSVQATCNGEIYNYAELRRGLERDGHRFRSDSDVEVIPHLYETHGADFVQHLQGMFAFAVWDAREQLLILGRDRLGVKPLYWAQVPGGILYASEPGPILASGLIEPAVDPAAIVQYLTLQYVPPPLTGFRGINKLAPGQILTFRDGAIDISTYWALDYADEPAVASDADMLDRLDGLMLDATRDRLMADVPLGAFLSGGIDSSLVVAYMAELLPEVSTFSIDFPVEKFSEGVHARRVAGLYGTRHQEFVVEPDIVATAAEAARFAGEPFADSSAVPTYLLSQLTRQKVTVALSGDGGDEAFGGYLRYKLAAGSERFGSAATGLGKAADAVLPAGVRKRYPLTGRAVQALLRPPDERYASMMAQFTPEDIERLCESPFLEEAGGARRAWDEVLKPPVGVRGVNRFMALDVATYLPGDLLPKVDRMSMAHGLEVRSPFLDYRVQEFAAGLPANVKLRRGTTKWCLKELALRRGLPSDLVHRRKQGFGIPVGDWFRGELRPWLESILLDPQTIARGYFRHSEVRRLLDEHLSSQADHTSRLWNLVMLELWHRTWLDHA
jgi:asparagine synthase (glutamine-hydrolysing)